MSPSPRVFFRAMAPCAPCEAGWVYGVCSVGHGLFPFVAGWKFGEEGTGAGEGCPGLSGSIPAGLLKPPLGDGVIFRVKLNAKVVTA